MTQPFEVFYSPIKRLPNGKRVGEGAKNGGHIILTDWVVSVPGRRRRHRIFHTQTETENLYRFRFEGNLIEVDPSKLILPDNAVETY